MLIRDLWKPREAQRFFDAIRLELADGRCLYIEKQVAPGVFEGQIYCCVKDSPSSEWDEFAVHNIDDELTAQAVLDHYVQTIGVKNKSEM